MNITDTFSHYVRFDDSLCEYASLQFIPLLNLPSLILHFPTTNVLFTKEKTTLEREVICTSKTSAEYHLNQRRSKCSCAKMQNKMYEGEICWQNNRPSLPSFHIVLFSMIISFIYAWTSSFSLFSIISRPLYVFQTSLGALLTTSQLTSLLVKWDKSLCFFSHSLSLRISMPELMITSGVSSN
jgi:hypothetical protein